MQAELTYLQAHLATLELPSPSPLPPPPQQLMAVRPPLSISDLPSASSVPATYDLSSLFDRSNKTQPSWIEYQRCPLIVLSHRLFWCRQKQRQIEKHKRLKGLWQKQGQRRRKTNGLLLFSLSLTSHNFSYVYEKKQMVSFFFYALK